MNLAKLENEIRKRQLQQKNDKRLIDKAETELGRFKFHAEHSETSLKKLTKFNIQYANHQELMKHKKIWFEEKDRLDILCRVTEMQYHHLLSQILSQIPSGDKCYAVASEISYDIDNSHFEEERKGLHERVSSLIAMKQVPMNEAQEDNYLELLDELTLSVLKELENLNTRFCKVARQLEKLPKPKRKEPEEVLDQWVEINGTVRKFKEVKFQQSRLQDEHEKYCDELINEYHKQLESLKAHLLISHKYPENDYLLFQKLKEEYYHQVGDRFVLLSERVRKELPHLTKEQISELYDISNKRQSYIEKKLILYRVFMDQCNDLVDRTIKSVLEEEEYLKKEMERDLMMKARIEDMELRHHRLRKFREEKLQNMKLEAETRKIELEKQLVLENKRIEREQQRRMRTKQELALYHQELMQLRIEEEKTQNQLKERENYEKRLAAKVN
jgi:hypothetical protein